jgi:hypothetical protein
VLNVKATNVGSVTVHPERARVSCNVRVKADSDGPLRVTLAGCNRTVSFRGNRSARCADSTRPRSKIPRRARKRLRNGKVRLRGTATDRGCGKKRKVRRVLVSVARLRKHGCQFVRANGRLTKTRNCNLPVLLRAKGTRKWRYTTRRRLPRGTYRATARAVDTRGNTERPKKRRNTIRFRVR